MSEKQLRELVDHASAFCDKVFADKGEVLPMWHAIKRDGHQFIEPHPMNALGKDLAAALIRAQFDLEDVVRYVYIGEAWTVDQRGDSDADMQSTLRIARQGRLHEHPNRIEIVQVQGEDEVAGQIVAQRQIVRPAHGKPYLAPLKFVVVPGDGVVSEGRTIGMLPVRGRRQ